jgi:hypothetical protein
MVYNRVFRWRKSSDGTWQLFVDVTVLSSPFTIDQRRTGDKFINITGIANIFLVFELQ